MSFGQFAAAFALVAVVLLIYSVALENPGVMLWFLVAGVLTIILLPLSILIPIPLYFINNVFFALWVGLEIIWGSFAFFGMRSKEKK